MFSPLSLSYGPVPFLICANSVSIRAYAAQETMEQELRRRVDESVRLTRTFSNIGRWMPTRIEFLGALFSSCLAGYLVYFSGVDAATAGFSLNMAGEYF